MDIATISILVMLTVLGVRWGYALITTVDKPPEWEPRRLYVWPLRLKRDGYRRLLAVSLVFYVGIAVVIGVALLR